MKKILVAGAGHGGLTAAINLAKNGYDVTVIEEKQREKMGHDWEDFLNMTAFDMSGIPRPSEDMYTQEKGQGFRNPSATEMIRIGFEPDSITMDRKVLISYLLDCAEEAGVNLVFGHKILSPIVYSATVKGLNISDGENKYRLMADLIIDAAGMYSPVRSNLPLVCGIQKKLEPKDVFHVYRAYYANPTCQVTEPEYIVDLFHMNRPGIDWTITHDDHMDILIGKFGSAGELTQEDVNEALTSYKNEYPFLTDKIVRGGYFADIPLSKMLPVIVCDGYAAIGDSAGMTVPLNGSGMVLSMHAGKILADTVMKAEGTYDKKALWPYEYEYFQTMGQELVFIAVLKNFFNYITGEHVDYLMENGVLTADQLSISGGKGIELSPQYLGHVASVSLPLYKLLAPLLKNFKGMPLLPLLSKTMPKEYDEAKVNNWLRLYSAF